MKRSPGEHDPSDGPAEDAATDIRREKVALRGSMEQTLDKLSAEEIRERSRRATDHLTSSSLWTAAGGLLSFASMPAEVQTDDLMRLAREQGKRLALPRMSGNHLMFHEIVDDPPRLVRRVWGIREPDPAAPKADVNDPTAWPAPLILVPGLAFDTLGHRLGRGRGFYDRFLATLSTAGKGLAGQDRAGQDQTGTPEPPAAAGAATVGFGFQCQIVARVPSDEWDIRVDYILTEEALRRAGGATAS